MFVRRRRRTMAHQATPVYHAHHWYTDPCVCCNNGCCCSTTDEKVECDLCCAAIFCPCAVLNSNVKMMQTRTYHPPCEFECTKPCSIMACLTVASAVIRVVGWETGIFLDLLNLGPLYSFQWRSALREKYGINGDPCSDCICHWCCNPCVLCQEHIELRKRNGGPTGLPPHAIVMAQPYAGGWTQGYAPGQQAMPAASYGGPPGGGHGPVPVYTATVPPRGPPTVFQQPGGGVAMATLSTDQSERPAQTQAQPYGTEPPGSVYYAPPQGKAQGG